MPASTTGTWSSLFDWPLIGIHSVLTQDGKVLSFGTDLVGKQGAVMYHDVWDPVTGVHQTIDHHTQTATDIFCANAIVVPGSNNILIGGGDARPLGSTNTGVADVNNFNTTTNQIAPDSHGQMAFARWYATSINLNNGQILQLGGSDRSGTAVKIPEVYTPGEGWRTLTGAFDANVRAAYDRAFVRADGKVVYFNDSGNVMLLDTAGAGSIVKIGILPFGYNWESSATLYTPGKILVADAGTGLWTMDITGATPVFTKVADLGAQRNYASMTVLADGKVLINGGSTSTNVDTTAIKTAVIWNPANNSLTTVDAEAVPRLYHSTTILLPDGSILSMGGGSFGGGPGPYMADQQNGQIYKPAYLYNSSGTLATRPIITDNPEHVQAGTQFTIQVANAADISKLTFVKSGAATHDFNMNSGFMNLTYTVGADNTITVNLPGTLQGLTAGSWMLFVWNNAGVPSMAPVIEVDPVFNTGAVLNAANLLTNGSFETAATFDQSNFEFLDDLAGWHSTANNFELWKSGLFGVAAKDGATFMELDAQRGTIWQDVNTKAGQTYDLSFDFAGRASYILSSKIEVLWNGNVIATISPTDAIFKTYTFKVTGSGGDDRLSFRSLASDTDSFGGLLDKVVLELGTAAPPPNLIANANMESQTIAGDNFWQGFTNSQSTGWQNGRSNNVVLVNYMGSQMLDLDPVGSADELFQTVQTQAAQTYTLSFDAIATAAGSSAFQVLWNGGVIATVDPSTTTLQNFVYSVVGTGGLDKLSFRELASQNDYLGSYLDNVSLVAGSSGPVTVNLITNGAMQNVGITGTAGWQGFSNLQMSGWKNAGADFVVLVNHLGSQMLDLDPGGAADELYQMVQTTAAQSYTLSFDAVGTAAGSSAFDVVWNGVVVASINPNLGSLQHFTFTVSGTGNLDKLSFRELSGQNDFLGAYLDNVSLVSSPTIALATAHNGNHMMGTATNDVMTGTIGMDHVMADAGNDVINSGGGNDLIDAGAGNDTINGSFGADFINGAAGVDTITFSTAAAGVTVDLVAGIGSRGDAAGDRYSNIENVTGSNHSDILVLGGVSGQIDGLGGNDKIVGGAAVDLIFGGLGNDHISGGKGNDKINGDAGVDQLFGGNGADILTGGSGVDTLNGGAGADKFHFSAQSEVGDIIQDFAADDFFTFSKAAFGNLALGTLSTAAYRENNTGLAGDKSDRFIYDLDDGKLYYDSNGSAAGGTKFLVATLDSEFNISNADILII